jgi:hypothetical protein
MLRITTPCQSAPRLSRTTLKATDTSVLLMFGARAITGFVLRSLSSCRLDDLTEPSRRFFSSLPPLFAARRCATRLYSTSPVATKGVH